MIEKVIIKGLPSYGKKVIDLKFNEDINIITGVNGQGKTTLLKLIWYVYSGNLGRAVTEIEFDYIHMVTNTHEIIVEKCSEERMHFLQMESENHNHSGYDTKIYDKSLGKFVIDTSDLSDKISVLYCSEMISSINEKSLYFPTFRRIEGFSSMKALYREKYGMDNDEDTLLSNVMKKISGNLSYHNHKYITSVSTKDINELITSKYAEISEGVNNTYKILTDHVEEVINHPSGDVDNKQLRYQLEEIKSLLESNKKYREYSFKPIQAINDIVTEVFKRKGVKINNMISLGEQKQIIDSDYLSAGEKQMLSFIAYNALYSNTPIIIDEPEISLHVDWQRKLLRILTSQNTRNQLIVATHSPFIYAKYGDKEIIKDLDSKENNIDMKNDNKEYIDHKELIRQMKIKLNYKELNNYE
ncbi:AAA family ATPase [Bacillus paranthracis]|uniref:AAA family ATPase n=1 Tax=Bacillus paranthracis TaxID=2026186 RepID=UPI002DBFC40D|nr:AAA family ATPase [Bacillus paranthracis]MEC3525529.1 AAA family ATPase [Bacillus paranthracis]